MSGLPRRVLHVLNGAGGGAALSTIALIEALAAQGVESWAVCDAAGTAAERDRLARAVGGRLEFTRLYWWNRKIRSPLWRRPLIELRQLWATGWGAGSARRVADLAARCGAELIHTNTLLTPEGGRAARRLRLPHVWHVRELVGPGQPFQLPYHGPALGRYLGEHCAQLVANSATAARLLAPWMPAGLLTVVPNGIDLSRFVPRPGAVRRPLVVAMIGSLTSRSKQHARFIEAAAGVDRGLPIEWRIYGHDPSRGGQMRGDAYVDALRRLVERLGLAERFRWPGFVADPAQIVAEIDLLVHPADNESFGRIAVEGMAGGLPVVGVRGGGVAEIVEHEVTGLLAPAGDTAALAQAIERLARDAPLRQRLGQAGRRRAEEHFSLESCVARMADVYRAALAHPSGRRPTPHPAPAISPHESP
jgi:glycosyltransferase involved in cell wall biosynthesis